MCKDKVSSRKASEPLTWSGEPGVYGVSGGRRLLNSVCTGSPVPGVYRDLVVDATRSGPSVRGGKRSPSFHLRPTHRTDWVAFTHPAHTVLPWKENVPDSGTLEGYTQLPLCPVRERPLLSLSDLISPGPVVRVGSSPPPHPSSTVSLCPTVWWAGGTSGRGVRGTTPVAAAGTAPVLP